ncbi:unnamed protein product [Ectocarpus sp. CCAP 1310/34]|nr:unnamed protein product [Ectocarpus sp. CCAP 1310/34]
MSTMDVQFAASVLGLESEVGPLGDMTSEVRVAQDFNHELLEPALQELKSALRVGRFEGQHVALAEKLLDRIKKLLQTRRERDRVRREKQARGAATREAHEREKSEKKRVHAVLEELRIREAREREERDRKRAEEKLKELRDRKERERVEETIKALEQKLTAERRRATRAISQAKRAKKDTEVLCRETARGGGGDGKRVRLVRECMKLVQQRERRRPTVLYYRNVTTFRLDCVRVAPSNAHGHGLFSTLHAEAGCDVFVAVLPDCGKEQGYTPDKYNDYVHVAHKDGESAALIDFGSTVEGILDACHEDVKAGYIRAMNHASLDGDVSVLLDLREACVPDWYFSTGGVEYNVWYACHVVAKRAIKPGDELRFSYAWTPAGWK